MTSVSHPPANHRCQIYSETTSVRCINTGTHWEGWGGGCGCGGDVCTAQDCEKGFFSWECDGPHLYGETNSAMIPTQREAA